MGSLAVHNGEDVTEGAVEAGVFGGKSNALRELIQDISTTTKTNAVGILSCNVIP